MPRKNLADLGGRPLLAWTIEAALLSGRVARVIVTTDSEEIAEAAVAAGAETPFLRPQELAQDNVHSVHTVINVLDWLGVNENCHPSSIMMLLPTSPFRRPSQVRDAVDTYEQTGAPAVISVAPTGKYLTNFRYIRNDLLVPVDPSEDVNGQRQGREMIYAVNGSIYIGGTRLLREMGSFHVPGAAAFIMPQESSLDINDHTDLAYARRVVATTNPWTTEEIV